jgi:hypothetical protein
MGMRCSLIATIALCWLAWCNATKAQPAAPASDSLAVLRQARADIAALAAPRMKGRGYVAGGYVRAAQYLRQRFAQLARQGTIKLLPPDTFSFDLNVLLQASLRLGKQRLRLGTDFMPTPYTAPINAKLEIADVGYGLAADLQANNPFGKLAVVREGLPPNHGLADSLARLYRDEFYKLALLHKAGAQAVVLLRDKKLTHALATEFVPLPVLQVLASAWRTPKGGVPYGMTAAVNIAAKMQSVTVQNVVAVIPARAPTDSNIIVCAHYDHLGMVRGVGGSPTIFYGANDNASGTAFLLALAKQLQAMGSFKYNIVLLATAAEEAGLLGATHYVRRDDFKPAATKFVLNFDLMGNGQGGMVAVGGVDYPFLYNRFVTINTRMHAVPQLRARANAPNSDHWPFTQAGIPALFWYTEGGKPHYHDVNDRPGELSLPVFYNCLNLVGKFLQEVAQ